MMLSIGERLRAARRGVGLSLRQAAPLIGVSAQMISKYENNLTTPNSARLRQLAEAYSVGAEYFFRTPEPIVLEFVHECCSPYWAGDDLVLPDEQRQVAGKSAS